MPVHSAMPSSHETMVSRNAPLCYCRSVPLNEIDEGHIQAQNRGFQAALRAANPSVVAGPTLVNS